MAGFVYACCRLGQLQHTKIGFTTQNPHLYTKNFARTLCPLQVLDIKPFSNARLAESMVFHILHARRVEATHEVFDLSHETGRQDLAKALDDAARIDVQAGLMVPEVPEAPGRSPSSKKGQCLTLRTSES